MAARPHALLFAIFLLTAVCLCQEQGMSEAEEGSGGGEAHTAASYPSRSSGGRRKLMTSSELAEHRAAYKAYVQETMRKKYEDEECDLFAKLLSRKMRKLPSAERYSLMHEIDSAFLNMTAVPVYFVKTSGSYTYQQPLQDPKKYSKPQPQVSEENNWQGGGSQGGYSGESEAPQWAPTHE